MIKKKWKDYWVKKELEIIEQARQRAKEYLESEESHYVMAMRFRLVVIDIISTIYICFMY